MRSLLVPHAQYQTSSALKNTVKKSQKLQNLKLCFFLFGNFQHLSLRSIQSKKKYYMIAFIPG